MTLRLDDKWIWDFWLARDGAAYHIFYLQAPRALEREELRHWNVSIGHAVSHDLRTWKVLPDALRPGPAGAWDDYTTWTGSVVAYDGRWYLFYTGTTRAEEGLVQRIGLAISEDLITWRKHPDNPLIEADTRWYELLDRTLWHDQAWRDPYVIRHPETDTFHAFITARCNYGPAGGRGVIGHARSDNLIEWEVLPPLTEPGRFGHLEIPQWVSIGARYYLLFSVPAAMHAENDTAPGVRRPVTGTAYFMADTPLGPFELRDDPFLIGDERESLYGGKLVHGPGNQLRLLAWRFFASDGSFIGDLADPLPVSIDATGRLSVRQFGK